MKSLFPYIFATPNGDAPAPLVPRGLPEVVYSHPVTAAMEWRP